MSRHFYLFFDANAGVSIRRWHAAVYLHDNRNQHIF